MFYPRSAESDEKKIIDGEAHYLELKLSESRQAVTTGTKSFENSFADLYAAIRETVRWEALRQDAEQRDSYLLNVAGSNRAEWSGGPLQLTNITETIYRDVALKFLTGRVRLK